ncbi:MAG: hypothetical protein AAB596_03045 [Patescibacteria group bacterium]
MINIFNFWLSEMNAEFIYLGFSLIIVYFILFVIVRRLTNQRSF